MFVCVCWMVCSGSSSKQVPQAHGFIRYESGICAIRLLGGVVYRGLHSVALSFSSFMLTCCFLLWTHGKRCSRKSLVHQGKDSMDCSHRSCLFAIKKENMQLEPHRMQLEKFSLLWAAMLWFAVHNLWSPRCCSSSLQEIRTRVSTRQRQTIPFELWSPVPSTTSRDRESFFFS